MRGNRGGGPLQKPAKPYSRGASHMSTCGIQAQRAQLQGGPGASPAAPLGRASQGRPSLPAVAASYPGRVWRRQAPLRTAAAAAAAHAAAASAGVTSVVSGPRPTAALHQPICTLKVLQPLLRVSHALLLHSSAHRRRLPLPHAGKGGGGCGVCKLPAVSSSARPLLLCWTDNAGHATCTCTGTSTGAGSLASGAGQQRGPWPQLPRHCCRL